MTEQAILTMLLKLQEELRSFRERFDEVFPKAQVEEEDHARSSDDPTEPIDG